MKLILCTECHRVLSLHREVETCRCGRSGGRYLDDCLTAEIWGPCVPLGFANPSFSAALRNRPDDDWGEEFTAFVIQKNCPTVRVLDPPPVVTNTPR